MSTENAASDQDARLHNANGEPVLALPDAASLSAVTPAQAQAWRLRSLRIDCDLVDAISITHPRLNELSFELSRHRPFDEECQAIVQQLEEEARELFAAVDDANRKAEAEAHALWHLPSVARVDAALLDRRRAVLPRWMPTGSFDTTGVFRADQDENTIQVSPGGCWFISSDRYAHRYGTGLTALWAEVTGEAQTSIVHRFAERLGIGREPA